MTRCLLIRHAAHDLLGHVLVGRAPGVRLGEEGRRQAAALAHEVGQLGVTHIQSSPRERALDTAAPIAKMVGLEVQVCPDLDEIDFGPWTGRTFEELERDPVWRHWNEERALARPPEGESMAEAQERLIEHLARTHAAHPHGLVVMVTHAELIRTAVLHYLSWPLDCWHQIAVPPASLTSLSITSATGAVMGLSKRIAA